MKHREILCSVIIPTYNRAALLPDALESILSQELAGDAFKLQIIVVDDGSTDDTAAVIARYGSAVEYVYQSNQGAAAARNKGLGLARGDYITFLDSDDVWLPQKLATEYEAFQQYTTAQAIISDSEAWREGQLHYSSRFQRIGFLTLSSPQFIADIPLLWVNVSLFATSSLILTRHALQQLSPQSFDPSLSVYEDWKMEMHLYQQSPVLVLPDIFVKVRRFDDGTRGQRPLPGQLTLQDEIYLLECQDCVLESMLKEEFDRREEQPDKLPQPDLVLQAMRQRRIAIAAELDQLRKQKSAL